VKYPKIKEVIKVAVSSVLAVGLFGGFLVGLNIFTLQAAISGEIYIPATENVSVPDNPVAEDFPAPSLTAIDISLYHDEASPLALSIDDAAQIGAQYIWDVFGQDIDGMYVELSYSSANRTTRSHWTGAVSASDRHTLARRALIDEMTDTFMYRIEAGDDPITIREEWVNYTDYFEYVSGCFYFVIDAITGERIDIWIPFNVAFSIEQTSALHAYLERNWGDNLSAAFAVEATPEQHEIFGPIAQEYGQRHFNNTAVVSVMFVEGFATLLYVDRNTFYRDITLRYDVMDETGRIASVSINESTRTATGISTMRNDMIMIPIEIGLYLMENADGWWDTPYLEGEYDDAARRRMRIENRESNSQ